MLTLYVGHTYQKITATTGLEIATKKTFVLQGDYHTDLQDFTLKNDWGNIIITLPGVISRKKISPPREVEQALEKYFREYHLQNKPGFDCYVFTNMVKGVTDHPPSFYKRFWKIVPLRSKKKIGSVIFLFKKGDCRPCHTAVYIGKGMFLSVHGVGGNIGFSSLRNLKQTYGATDLVIAKPKKS